ncbi:hypothetical protein QTP81_00275 [Alteromonas sp. ASW11-36]|uniref:Uncharacterized protein n=1 Tax=Alteromonas arenosi TaxID=3055817 RepID=A0ABT7SS68_9ALTE|nr:hypothetical protein [Alteromonas sp. ASW11-36]MDM7859036.1 hypothetical protein [Alteromonas sp. ASW11-36]
MVVWILYNDFDLSEVNSIQRSYYQQTLPETLNTKLAIEDVDFQRLTDATDLSLIRADSLLLCICSASSVNDVALNRLLIEFKMRSKNVFALVLGEDLQSVVGDEQQKDKKKKIDDYFPAALLLDYDTAGNTTEIKSEPIAVAAGPDAHSRGIAVKKFTAAIFDVPYRELTQRQNKVKNAVILVVLIVLSLSTLQCVSDTSSSMDKFYEQFRIQGN